MESFMMNKKKIRIKKTAGPPVHNGTEGPAGPSGLPGLLSLRGLSGYNGTQGQPGPGANSCVYKMEFSPGMKQAWSLDKKCR